MTFVASVMTFLAFVRVLGFTLTLPQRVFALVVFDGAEPRDLRGREREVASVLFGDVDVVPALARAVIVALLGARSGKSLLSALFVLWRAHVADLSRLAPGETAFGVIVAPDTRLARQPLGFARGALAASPLASSLVGSTSDGLTIRRADGREVAVEVLPATRGGSAVRGRTLFAAVLEESAFFRDETAAVNDAELFAAVTPRLLPGGCVLLVSTPWIRAGLLHELHEKNYGRPRTALVARASTLVMREGDAQIAAVADRERERDPANYEREFEAQFADAVGALLDPAEVDAAIDRGVTNREPVPGIVYGETVDVGLRRDQTAGMIFHVETREREGAPPVRVLVVDAIRILAPSLLRRVTIDEVEEMVASLARRYRVTKVRADLHYADALGPRLTARGLKLVEVPMSPGAQEKRVASLAAAFAAGAVRLVDDATLIKQCKGVRLTRRAGGGSSVGAAEGRGRHDDAFDALLLAAEVAQELPPSGDADVRCVLRGNLDSPAGLVPRWERRRRGPFPGTFEWVPTAPPTWSPMREQYEADLAAQGITMGDSQFEGVAEENRAVGPNIPVRR